MIKTNLFALAVLCAAGLALVVPMGQAQAAVKGEPVAYKQGDAVLDGYLAYDDAAKAKQPGVVVFPDWYGITDYAEARAQKLARLGYVVFIADIYGKGIHPKTVPEAAAAAGKLRKDPALLHARAEAAFDQLRSNPHVNPDKLATMGYCFGAQSALGLARAGDNLVDTVTFHGDVANANPADAKNIKGHVLVFWGADDPNVTAKAMDAFESEMRATHVDWQVVTYANTVHSFTVPSAGNDPSTGNAYNPIADRRSWQAMREFLHETLAN